IDNDYSTFEKVYQYRTYYNFESASGKVSSRTIINSNIVALQGTTAGIMHQNNTTGNAGLWYTFMLDYIKYMKIPLRRDIILIPAGRNGTRFYTNLGNEESWSAGGLAYDVMTLATNDAMNANHMHKVKGLLIHIGESDMSNINPN